MRGRRYLQPGERPQTSPQSMHVVTARDPRSGSPMNIDSFLQTVLDMKTNMHKQSAPPAGVVSPRRQTASRPRRDAFHKRAPMSTYMESKPERTHTQRLTNQPS